MNDELETLKQKLAELEALLRAREKEAADRSRSLEIPLAEMRQQARELERSNEELKQFAYAASHDLQEPLLVVENCAAHLAQRLKAYDDDYSNRLVAEIGAGAARMKTMLKDLLEYSKVGFRSRPFELVNCQQIFEKAAAHHEKAIQECRGIVIGAALPSLHGDEGQLLQLFLNLIGNALKFRSNRRLELKASAKELDDEWLFTVADNGIGFDPKETANIFKVFHRLHGDEYSGTGMGLAICKKIVERHGGRIWAESEPGQGSVFFFTLPKESRPSSSGFHYVKVSKTVKRKEGD